MSKEQNNTRNTEKDVRVTLFKCLKTCREKLQAYHPQKSCLNISITIFQESPSRALNFGSFPPAGVGNTSRLSPQKLPIGQVEDVLSEALADVGWKLLFWKFIERNTAIFVCFFCAANFQMFKFLFKFKQSIPDLNHGDFCGNCDQALMDILLTWAQLPEDEVDWVIRPFRDFWGGPYL